jgi:Gpi18-like mannosyltransferase
VAGLAGAGHGGDLRAFEQWAEGVAHHGLGGYYAAGGDANYPAMLYLLWPLGTALDGAALWTAIRLLSVPFDLALGVLLYDVGRRLGGSRTGWPAAAFYLLNPAIVLSGPAWGQVDGMGALPMLGALVAVSGGTVVAAGVLATLAVLVKPQFGVAAAVIAGLMVGWLRTGEGIRRAALLALAAVVAFAAVLLPLHLDPLAYRAVLADTLGRYPYFSLFGFNPWAMVFGFGTRDGDWFGVGIVLTVVAVGLSLVLLRRRRDLVGLLGVASLIALALYFVPTRVHERYLYGAIVLLAPLAAVHPRLRSPFVVLSGLFLATLAFVALTSPYAILAIPGLARWAGDPWVVRLLSGAMTLSGAWCAWRLVELVRTPAEPPGEAAARIDR